MVLAKSRIRSLVRPLLALSIAWGCVAAPLQVDAADPPLVTASLPAWDGDINLYRTGVFTWFSILI